MTAKTVTARPWISTDRMLGIAGGGIAAASLGFGVYMSVHGPSGGLGHSGDFTVFAQLAPRQTPAGPMRATPASTVDAALDATATASVPKVAADAGGRNGATAETSIIPTMTLQAAAPDVATIEVGGRIRTVRIGDDVPGAGEVLEIRTAPRAVVRTSRGLIVAARDD